MARGRLRAKLPELRRALDGRVQPHHRVRLAHQLAHIDFLEATIADLQQAIAAARRPYVEAVALLQTIPGVGPVAVMAIAAAIGVDMGGFRRAATAPPGPGAARATRSAAANA